MRRRVSHGVAVNRVGPPSLPEMGVERHVAEFQIRRKHGGGTDGRAPEFTRSTTLARLLMRRCTDLCPA